MSASLAAMRSVQRMWTFCVVAGGVERICEREIEAVDVALAGARLRHAALQPIPGFEQLRRDRSHLETRRAWRRRRDGR